MDNYINQMLKYSLQPNFIENDFDKIHLSQVAEIEISFRLRKQITELNDELYKKVMDCVHSALHAISNVENLEWDFYDAELIFIPNDISSIRPRSVIRARFFAKEKEKKE